MQVVMVDGMITPLITRRLIELEENKLTHTQQRMRLVKLMIMIKTFLY